MKEKTEQDILLPSQHLSTQAIQTKSSTGSTPKAVFCIVIFVLAQCLFGKSALFNTPGFLFYPEHSNSLCPQAAELLPQKNRDIWLHQKDTFSTDVFKARAVEWLGGAVRIP